MPEVRTARVTVIPAKKDRLPIAALGVEEKKRLRVAAYARVSTNNEEQLTSYEAQVDYYTRYIQSKEEWEFVEVYTDEGISATNTKKRGGFNRMVEDALAGKIDFIITKVNQPVCPQYGGYANHCPASSKRKGSRCFLRRRISAPSTARASCLLPSCPRWRRKKAVLSPKM